MSRAVTNPPVRPVRRTRPQRIAEPLRGPEARKSVHANVYAAMKQALMRGQYKPGQKITIRGVASTLGTSATPVRDLPIHGFALY